MEQERNPETTTRFRSEAWWQITFPVVAAGVIVIVLMVLIVPLTTVTGASVSADYAVAILFIPAAFILILSIAVLGGTVYLMVLVLQILPTFAYKVQRTFEAVKQVTDDYTDRAASALIIAERSRTTGVSKVIRDKFGGNGSGTGN